MKNQNGFSYVLIISLLPIFLSMVFSLFFIHAFLSPKEEFLQICRATLLHSEKLVAIKLTHLLSLNKEVLKLRFLRSQAELALRIALASAQPQAILLARQALQAIILSQKTLAFQQAALITQGNALLWKAARESHAQLRRAANHYSQKLSPIISFESAILPSSVPILAIQKTKQEAPGPPIYELKNNFTQAQSISNSWKFSEKLNGGTTAWSKPVLESKNSCSASLKIKNGVILETLMPDKL